MRLWIVWTSIGLGGCGYRECGTLEYWTSTVDPTFDVNADQYLDLAEACSADYGSFGSQFPDVGLTQLLIDWSRWDTSETSDLAFNYLTATEILFRTDHLVEGEVMTLDSLGGMGFHKPAGSFDSPTISWPLTSGRIEVLAGPREAPSEEIAYNLRYSFVIGTPDDAAPRGYQVLDGEDWVSFDASLWAWDAAGHPAPPPDWVAPG